MKRNLFVIVGMLLSLSVSGPALAIYDGTPVASDSKIAKVTFKIVVKADDGASLCSSTLIDSRILLSAAHCFGDEKNPTVFVEYFSSTDKKYQRIHISQWRVHPDYAGQMGEHDLAMLLLDSPIPGSELALLPTADTKISDHQKLIVAGLGFNKPYGNMSADQRFAPLANDPVAQPLLAILHDKASSAEERHAAGNELLIMAARNPLLMTKSKASMVHLDQGNQQATQMEFFSEGGHSACEGDSGGPSFVKQADGRLLLLGVHSKSTNGDCEGPKFYFLTRQSAAVDTFVPFELEWIQKTMQTLKATQSI